MKIGDSKGITLPALLTFGKTATLAANRIVVLDPRGEIPEDQLLKLLEEQIDPKLWLPLSASR